MTSSEGSASSPLCILCRAVCRAYPQSERGRHRIVDSALAIATAGEDRQIEMGENQSFGIRSAAAELPVAEAGAMSTR